jgi:DnaK suppressor protein
MAKPKQSAAKRKPKAARSAAKPARTKSVKKTAVKPTRKAPAKAARKAPAKAARKAPAKAARKAPVKTARKVAKPAPKKPTKSTRPAAKAAKKPAARKAAKTARTPKAPKTVRTSKTAKPKAAKTATPPKAVRGKSRAHKSEATAHAAPVQQPAQGTTHAPARKRTHVKPVGGVAARLNVGTADEQTITREDGRYALPATVNIDLPKGYRPNGKEEYMSPRQLAYFRQKLKDWRDQLVEESRQTMENLREEVRDVGDDAERATRETENSLELRTRDRYRKLISKIEKALRKIEEGRYGYCEETDEEIGLERLEARPIATLSLDAQERREHLQKQMGD